MGQLLRIGADVGVIGFVAVTVFFLCCFAALLVIGLIGWIVKQIGGDDDETGTTHTH